MIGALRAAWEQHSARSSEDREGRLDPAGDALRALFFVAPRDPAEGGRHMARLPPLATDRPAVMQSDGRLLACRSHGAHRPGASRTHGTPIGEGHACASSRAMRAAPCWRRWLGLLLIRAPCRKSPRRSARCF